MFKQHEIDQLIVKRNQWTKQIAIRKKHARKFGCLDTMMVDFLRAVIRPCLCYTAGPAIIVMPIHIYQVSQVDDHDGMEKNCPSLAWRRGLFTVNQSGPHHRRPHMHGLGRSSTTRSLLQHKSKFGLITIWSRLLQDSISFSSLTLIFRKMVWRVPNHAWSLSTLLLGIK